MEVLAAFPKGRSIGLLHNIHQHSKPGYAWTRCLCCARVIIVPTWTTDFNMLQLRVFVTFCPRNGACTHSISWLRWLWWVCVHQRNPTVETRDHFLCPHPRRAPRRSLCECVGERWVEVAPLNVNFLISENVINCHHMYICTSSPHSSVLQIQVIHNMHLKPIYRQSHDKVVTKWGCLRCTSTLWPLLASSLESVGSDSNTLC